MHHGAGYSGVVRTNTTDGKKIGNDNFLSRVQAEAIEEQRRRRTEAEQTQTKFADAWNG